MHCTARVMRHGTIRTEGTKNQEAYRIKKNEKGIKVYVPVEVTLLKIDGELVPLEMATKEEQIQYQAGEIEV